MPQRRQTSGGKLSDLAAHVILPTGIVSTGWPAVRDTCAGFAVRFDEWQDGLGRAILAKREDGMYAAGIGGVVISIARQVGKTFTIGAMIVALCVLFPGLKVVWTAHRTRTSDETFKSLQGLAARKKVAPHVLAVRQANGQQEIAFVNGSRILFGARESGFGRGFDDVDVLVFDEAQILTQKALDDMVPATNVSANPLILMMGTPPKPGDPSEAFESRRAEALAGESDDMLYVEFSADRNANPDDRGQWRKGNPSYPHRTPEGAMLRMKRQLGNESFLREGLGIWDERVTVRALIPDKVWADRHVNVAPSEGVVAYGVKFSPDGLRVVLGAARRPVDGPTHVEVIKASTTAVGTDWLVTWLTENWRKAAVIVVDGKAGSGPLVHALRLRHVPERRIVVPTLDKVIEAHAGFLEAVSTEKVTHYGQPGLAEVVKSATKRPIGKAGGWGWLGIGDGVDVTPLEAVTLAHHGAVTAKRARSRDDSGSRRAVILGG